MTRGKWTWSTEQNCLVPATETKRPAEAPNILTDEMEPLESMVDGSIWTSKARYREHLRANGLIEKGNDKAKLDTRHFTETEEYERQLKEDSERTYYAVRDGMAPLTELDKERCKIMDHNLREYNYDRRETDERGRILK